MFDRHAFSTIDARRTIPLNAPGEYMHYILYPSAKKGFEEFHGKFFTLQCDVCQVHFLHKPLEDARKHVLQHRDRPDDENATLHKQLFEMRGVRFNGSIKDSRNLLKVFGVEVTGCDESKQTLSNEAFVSKVNRHKEPSYDPNPYNVLGGKYSRKPKRVPVDRDLHLKRPYDSMEECLHNRPNAPVPQHNSQQPSIEATRDTEERRRGSVPTNIVDHPEPRSDTSPSGGMSRTSPSTGLGTFFD